MGSGGPDSGSWPHLFAKPRAAPGPLSNPVTLSNCSFVYCCCQWAFFLLPVPLSRIYLAEPRGAPHVQGRNTRAGARAGARCVLCEWAREHG